MNQIFSSVAPEIVEPAILITVDRWFTPDMSDADYEVTRGNWLIGEQRTKAKYTFYVYQGMVQQVYEIHGWRPM